MHHRFHSMKNPSSLLFAVIVVAGAAGDFVFAQDACAWGTAFTARAREAALSQLSFSLDGVAEPATEDGSGMATVEAQGPEALAAEVQSRVDALSQAFSSRDPIRTGEALDRLVTAALALWQPLDAATLLDPPGAARGFHFRYETMLAARIAATMPRDSGRQAQVVDGPAALALAIANQRVALIPVLVAAEERARTESNGLYNDRYYATLALDLGTDLESAFRGAADILADLVETAWMASNRGIEEAPAAIDLYPLGVGSGRWTARFFLAAPTQVTAILYSPTGRRLATLHEGPMPGGFHEISADLDRSPLPSGVYFLRLEAGRATATAKLPLFK